MIFFLQDPNKRKVCYGALSHINYHNEKQILINP